MPRQLAISAFSLEEAKTLVRALQWKYVAAQRPFTYLDSGIMAMVGRNAAVAEIGPQTLLEWLSEYIGHVNIAAILDQ